LGNATEFSDSARRGGGELSRRKGEKTPRKGTRGIKEQKKRKCPSKKPVVPGDLGGKVNHGGCQNDGPGWGNKGHHAGGRNVQMEEETEVRVKNAQEEESDHPAKGKREDSETKEPLKDSGPGVPCKVTIQARKTELYSRKKFTTPKKKKRTNAGKAGGE